MGTRKGGGGEGEVLNFGRCVSGRETRERRERREVRVRERGGTRECV